MLKAIVINLVKEIKILNDAWNKVPSHMVSSSQVLTDLKHRNSYLKQKSTVFVSDIRSFNQLVKSCYEFRNQIEVAENLSIKAADIIGIIPDLSPGYVNLYVSQMRPHYELVNKEFASCHFPNIADVEAIKTHLMLIRDCIRDLENIHLKDEDDLIEIKKAFRRLTQSYGDLKLVLLEFIRKILIL